MRRENMEALAQEFALSADPAREPELPFKTGWVQEKSNQLSLLDCFFGHFQPEESLCVFYAKQVPFVEEFGRVIVGVGRVKHIGASVEYHYQSQGELKCVLWERLVQHSIRPGFADGFLMPYQEALAHAEENSAFDPATIAAFAPEDRLHEFSFASEHVTADGAIGSLLACARSLEQAAKHFGDSFTRQLRWIDRELTRLWKLRGPCPGLGAALNAFGVERGHFVAHHLASQLGANNNPWPLVEKTFANPAAVLPPSLQPCVNRTLSKAFRQLTKERRTLLELVSRFDLTGEQASSIFVAEERVKAGIAASDNDFIQNPYLLYELTRLNVEPVSVWTVDRGVFPPPAVREVHPLTKPSAVDGGTDARRIRALTIHALEEMGLAGNTLYPKADIIRTLREMALDPKCEVTGDTMNVAEEETFGDEIRLVQLGDTERAYQLSRFVEMGVRIRDGVNKRIAAPRHTISADWRKLLDEELKDAAQDELEERARQEKTAALRELAESRFGVLIGPAGTGKTTLLSVLCQQPDIRAGGVLLLAPTGKARVRLDELANDAGFKAQTLAQFLKGCGRYIGATQRYRISDAEKAAPGKTVIVDEASMLTEEMLGALLDALVGVQRLILVGDPQQLPPIGPGRPFVDIVKRLQPANVHTLFPRVAQGYAELTIRRRQTGAERADLRLAEWFSGRPLAPGEDDVLESIARSGGTPNVQFVRWQTADEFQTRLIEALTKELGLKSPDDHESFDLKLGAKPVNDYLYFNLGAAAQAEAWQILSPIRAWPHGVMQVNRYVHKKFKQGWLEFARWPGWKRKIPEPMGVEEIVYGDKVICVQNHGREAWDAGERKNVDGYLANGEIGVAVGQFRTANMTSAPWALKVEFSSQPGLQFDFTAKGDFGEEAQPRLELAYALTVHKAQGSEFDLVILILPNPCRLLSRELLYTALTRQRNRVVVLHQGSIADLHRFSQDAYSETAKRLTNLFGKPKPVEIKTTGQATPTFLEEKLIHRTARGEAVRSKSEVIIADHLANRGLVYRYEAPLSLGGETRFPDFTVEDSDTGITYYWEHCGMFYDAGYRERWETKLRWYRQNGILPFEQGGGSNGTLIVTKDDAAGGISSAKIAETVKSVFG